jgi:hypothetical protein
MEKLQPRRSQRLAKKVKTNRQLSEQIESKPTDVAPRKNKQMPLHKTAKVLTVDNTNNLFLFPDFPSEVNLIILNYLDSRSIFRSAEICKRWLNNTKFVETLNLNIGWKGTRYFVEWIDEEDRDKINWERVEKFLAKFKPFSIRSLSLDNQFFSTNLHKGTRLFVNM